MHVINTLFPIFAVIALGAFLRRRHILNDTLKTGINKLAYSVGLPCLLFIKAATAEQPGQAELKCIAIILSGTLIVLGIAHLTANALKLSPGRRGAFLQAAFRGNNAYVGLQLVYFAFLSQGVDVANKALSTAAIALGPAVILYNVLSIMVLTPREKEHGKNFWKPLGVKLSKNPLIISIFAGIVWWNIARLTGWALPECIDRSIKTVGQIALPSALLCVGYAMADPKLYGHASLPALVTAFIRVVIAPLIGLPLIWLFRADAMTAGISLLVLGCPTALASYIMVEEMGGDKDVGAAAIVMSTGLSVITLSVLIAAIF